MKIEFKDNTIKLDRILSILDEFVLSFVDVLDELEIQYVIISGYIPLLFGRQRITEDVDIFLHNLDDEKLTLLFKKLKKEHWIINANSLDVFIRLWEEKIPIRAARKGSISPNMEIKQIKTEVDKTALDNAITVILNKRNRIKISPLELQISYKLFLGSKKDLEDARFLFQLFGTKLNKKILTHYIVNLGVTEKSHYLGGLNDKSR